MISIVTGDVLEGSLPRAELRAVQEWLATHREEVAYVRQEIRPDSTRILIETQKVEELANRYRLRRPAAE
jgi:hypothetical protein